MTSRSFATARRSLCSLVAIFALLAQTLVPHVHGRHDHFGALSTGAVTCDTTGCATLAASTPAADHDAHQHAAGCPLCRAQGDARTLVLPPSVVVPLPITATSSLAGADVTHVGIDGRSLAAPRAPPAVS